MAKRSERKRAIQGKPAPTASASRKPQAQPAFQKPLSDLWVALLLAAVAFLIYWPSLGSDFVYDSRTEIFQEGFITSLSNLPAVLSLKVLGMNLMLGPRPGQLLYLMLNAALWGREPFGYHLSGNLLHAANVALLFLLLRRLTSAEITGLTGNDNLKAQLAAAAVTLIFALHPITTEPVSNISYSSDLLTTFFILSALLAATGFRADRFRTAWLTGGAGVFCAFAAVACKESGLAAALLLVVYWFLFRRREAKGPWIVFLVGAMTATTLFLAARFLFAPQSILPRLGYLGGSFSQVFLIQPRLWIFMMGKLLWPVPLSADYTLEDLGWISTPVALVILAVVLLLQGWLATKSRLGALGVACYWLGLATVSNFMPLNRIVADRFYYLPLVGVAMQVLALLLMTLRWRATFWVAVTSCFLAIPPLTVLTLTREAVFTNNFTLWSDTVQASPFSSAAHNGLGLALFHLGRTDEAIPEYLRALQIEPGNFQAKGNLGDVFAVRGEYAKAIAYYQMALANFPNLPDAHGNLGVIFARQGHLDEAIEQSREALKLNPDYVMARDNLGNFLFAKGDVNEAMVQYRQVLTLDPGDSTAHKQLGKALLQTGHVDAALVELQEAVRLQPDDRDAQNFLAKAEATTR